MKRTRSGSFVSVLPPVDTTYSSSKMLSRAQRRMRFKRDMVLYKGVSARVSTFRKLGTTINITNQLGGSSVVPYVNGVAGGAVGSTVFVGNQSAGSAGTSQQFGGSIKFNLAAVAQFGELQALFDNYRIKKVYLKFIYNFNTSEQVDGGASLYSSLPTIFYAYDPDDSGIPATQADVLSMSRCKVARLDKIMNMSVSPRAQNLAVSNSSLSGGVVAGGIMNPKTWLDSNSTTVDHYGVKFWIDNWQTGLVGNNINCLQIIPTYILECKNVN